jgi:hypothetical protein
LYHDARIYESQVQIRQFKKQKIAIMKNLTTVSKLRLVEMVMQWLEGGIRMLLGHNTGGGAVRLWCAAVWFSSEAHCIQMHTYS